MGNYIDSFGVVLLVLGAIALAYLIGRLLLRTELPPYEKRPSLLTDAEREFFAVLRTAVDGAWSIQAMVRLADIIKVRSEAAQHQAWQNRILAKHLDFLLCDQNSLEALLAIELDDRTHERKDRQARDEFVNDALTAAGLPLLRVKTSAAYDKDKLREKIDEMLTRAK